MTRKTLFELDLTPRNETLIDLLGTSVPETFTSFGTCHGSRLAVWTPEIGEMNRKAYAEAERCVKGAKKAELVSFLTSRGRVVYAVEKRSSLRAMCMIAINEARSPWRFVNVAPNEWICGCGHVGPATYREVGANVGIPVCGGEGCTKPHYAMQLTAARAWVRSLTPSTPRMRVTEPADLG